MNDLVFNLLTNRRLERFRGVIPYPLYTGLVTLLLAIPLMLPMVFSERSPLGGGGLPFPACWALASLMPAGVIAGMMSLLALVGFISGHRPFRHAWIRLTPQEAAVLFERLLTVARWMGFDITWSDPGKGFVGVLNMEQEGSAALHSSDKAPVRIVVHLRDTDSMNAEVRLKLQIRTLVVWDTGEKARLQELGGRLMAQVSPPPMAVGGAA